MTVSRRNEQRNDLVQREEILESRNRRKKQLEAMLADIKDRLHDHETGAKLLLPEEKSTIEKKLKIFQKKLETMDGELNEREVERIIKREKLRNERLLEKRAEEVKLEL